MDVIRLQSVAVTARQTNTNFTRTPVLLLCTIQVPKGLVMFVSVLEVGKSNRWQVLSLGGGLTAAMIAAIEVAAITAISAITGAIWHQLAYGHAGEVESFMDVGILAGLFYTLPFLFGTDYRADNFLTGRRTLARILNVWTYAFFALAALAFLTKTTGSASRGGLDHHVR